MIATLNKVLVFIVLSLFMLTASSANNKTSVPKTFVKEAGSFRQLDDILISQGFNRSQSFDLLKNPIVPMKWHLNPKDKFLVIKNKEKTEVFFYLDYCDDALVFWRTKTDIGVEKRPVEFMVIKKTIEAPVIGSLNETIKKRVNDEWVVNRFTDAFMWDIDLGKKLKQKDKIKFILEKKYHLGQYVKNGEILEAEVKTGGHTYKRVLLVKDNRKVFLDPTNAFEDRAFYSPVDYVHISSGFSRKRFHPIRRRYIAHEGIDYALNEGAPVYAARDGVVTIIAKKRGNGHYVTVTHADGLISFYNHLKSAYSGLQQGQKISAGEVLGYVGCSGFCTSPHLHFAVKKNGRMINPTTVTKPYPYVVRGYQETSEFKSLIAALDTPSRETATLKQ